MRRYSESEEDFKRRACAVETLVIGEVLFGFSPCRGEVVAIGRLPEDMSGPDARRAVTHGVGLAVRRGAPVIGLGGLTSPATAGGRTVLSQLPPGTVVTNGNAYTAIVVCHNVMEAAQAVVDHRPPRIAVVGCTGSVGGVASQLLAEAGCELILIGRSVTRVRRILPELAATACIADSLRAAAAADVVLLLTNDPAARVSPEDVRPGAVVIDAAQPPAAAPGALEGRSVQVVQGGIVRIPRYTCTYDFGLERRDETFACLAETYLFAREGIREHSVGRPGVQLARRLGRLADRHGIVPRSLAFAPTQRSGTALSG